MGNFIVEEYPEHIWLGAVAVSKIMCGTEQVWPRALPPSKADSLAINWDMQHYFECGSREAPWFYNIDTMWLGESKTYLSCINHQMGGLSIAMNDPTTLEEYLNYPGTKAVLSFTLTRLDIDLFNLHVDIYDKAKELGENAVWSFSDALYKTFNDSLDIEINTDDWQNIRYYHIGCTNNDTAFDWHGDLRVIDCSGNSSVVLPGLSWDVKTLLNGAGTFEDEFTWNGDRYKVTSEEFICDEEDWTGKHDNKPELHIKLFKWFSNGFSSRWIEEETRWINVDTCNTTTYLTLGNDWPGFVQIPFVFADESPEPGHCTYLQIPEEVIQHRESGTYTTFVNSGNHSVPVTIVVSPHNDGMHIVVTLNDDYLIGDSYTTHAIIPAAWGNTYEAILSYDDIGHGVYKIPGACAYKRMYDTSAYTGTLTVKMYQDPSKPDITLSTVKFSDLLAVPVSQLVSSAEDYNMYYALAIHEYSNLDYAPVICQGFVDDKRIFYVIKIPKSELVNDKTLYIVDDTIQTGNVFIREAYNSPYCLTYLPLSEAELFLDVYGGTYTLKIRPGVDITFTKTGNTITLTSTESTKTLTWNVGETNDLYYTIYEAPNVQFAIEGLAVPPQNVDAGEFYAYNMYGEVTPPGAIVLNWNAQYTSTITYDWASGDFVQLQCVLVDNITGLPVDSKTVVVDFTNLDTPYIIGSIV